MPPASAPASGPSIKRIAAVVTVAAVTLPVAWSLKGSGHDLYGLMVLAAGAAGGRWVWRKLAPRPVSAAPMVSLVLLLREPRYLEPVVLAEIIRSAWGLAIEVAPADGGKDDAPAGKPFIVGNSPVFMVGTGEGMFVVHNHERLYFDPAAEVAEKVPDLRLRKIILDHRAWLSVDAMGVGPEEDVAPYYARISKLLAELANDAVLGLFQPASSRLTPWDATLVERLRRGENLGDLFQVQQAPVVQVSEDDPRMKAAVAEAKRRWPEFVAAFKARQPGGNYAVKAAVTRDGNTEFIWIEVVGLEPEFIHGKLANDPVDLGDLKIGDQVEVPLAALNDWTFRHAEADEPQGLFTVRILSETFSQQVNRATEPG
ncbi:MAG: DUF2314 domain-containing protein [Verrucomicrobia bacterium]|nr:DUF2314 domain-containing protein [Verrucomicrobiota bacterium]